ncbi:hypothetical protein MRX96_019262 [Rhipicephalus microplus]
MPGFSWYSTNSLQVDGPATMQSNSLKASASQGQKEDLALVPLLGWKHGAYNENLSSLPLKEPGVLQPADKVKSFFGTVAKLYVLINFP